MDNPWNNAWAEPEKEVVQEVTLAPKKESWITSPVSGDLGASWTTGWGTQTDTASAWRSTNTTDEPVKAPWETTDAARVAYVLGEEEPEAFVEETPPRVDEAEPEKEPEPVAALKEILNVPSLTPPDFGTVDLPPASPEPEKVEFAAPFATPNEEVEDSWRSLGNAAISVGDEGAWEGAWKPDAQDFEREATPEPHVDEWAQAMEEKVVRDAIIPSEVMDMILGRFNELSRVLWPDEDLEALREGPAPRTEWQGGLENVDGLTRTINDYLPPPPSAPPLHYANTQVAASFQNAMRMTKSYGMLQKSPIALLIKSSENWESSRIRGTAGKPFSLREWTGIHSSRSATPATQGTSTILFDAGSSHRRTGSLMDMIARPSFDRGRSATSSPAPRGSIESIPSIIPNGSTTVASTPPIASPTKSAFGTEAPTPTAAPSAVARFLNRFSRKADEGPKPPAQVNLKSEELDYLDMMPTINQGSLSADQLGKDIMGSYPGAQALSVGGLLAASSSITPSKPSGAAAKSLSQLTSEDFDSLLDAQIQQVEDDALRQSLVDTALMPGMPSGMSNNGSYSRISVPLFGSKSSTVGAQPLNAGSKPSSNSLFDEDDFDAFLSSPSKPAVSQPSKAPSIPLQRPSNFTSLQPSQPLPPRPASKSTATSSTRSSVVAIMSQSSPFGSRPGTPSTPTIAPLLPPPPGSRPMSVTAQKQPIDLLGGSMQQQPSKPAASDFGGLLDFSTPAVAPAANPKSTRPAVQSSTSGGLSAQDLSFFEGL
ncbi:SubName: Full=Uncharacterized protein {ECO:0000313/EMBL:CCA74654.1} [Serendipita indica DSM 11827]|nr:SubName: Full=Uncharacterized protein {ECO:0000313/EMBL:CCA74654.1} [Serendipita indica DSM 11827]